MHILLTNDDGYNSKGIKLLKEKLKKYGKVVLVAPLKHMSAKSVSLTLGQPIELVKIAEDEFAFDGTPADVVGFALTQFNIDFDLVVSGCNDGLNISYDTLYSGTIGACMRAGILGVKAIAFSQKGDFSIVDKYFDKVFQFVLDNNLLSNDYILNVNFPVTGVVSDIKISRQVHQECGLFYETNEEGHLVKRFYLPVDYPIDSEIYMVNHDIVSICPLQKTYFSEKYYDILSKKINKQ